jgi:hypothetical protein
MFRAREADLPEDSTLDSPNDKSLEAFESYSVPTSKSNNVLPAPSIFNGLERWRL